MSSEFLASSWKNFHGNSILNHTPCMHGVEMACNFEVHVEELLSFIKYRNKAYWELAKAIGTRSCSTCANTKLHVCDTVLWVKIS